VEEVLEAVVVRTNLELLLELLEANHWLRG
jgi:hypothetical protein